MLRAAAVTAVILAVAAPARAQPVATTGELQKKIVGILDIRVDGVSPTAAEKFEASIEEGLTSSEYWVATRKRMREMLVASNWSEGCSFGPCLLEVKHQTGADLVVVAFFQGQGSSYRFVVSLLETSTGTVREQVSDRCEACTLTEALDSAALATIGLVHGATGQAGPVAARPGLASPPPRGGTARRDARRTALVLIGTAALAGGAGLYFSQVDRQSLQYASYGAAGAFAVAGVLVLGVSFTLE